jgi:hypothetical protein
MFIVEGPRHIRRHVTAHLGKPSKDPVKAIEVLLDLQVLGVTAAKQAHDVTLLCVAHFVQAPSASTA